MIFSEREKDRLESRLKKTKIELTMRDRLDGWYIKSLEDKIKEIESKIRLKKHNFKDG
jgi:hypothetical protein